MIPQQSALCQSNSQTLANLGKEHIFMEEKMMDTGGVKNVFKNGQMPTKEEYTRFWIDMINHIERLKANQ